MTWDRTVDYLVCGSGGAGMLGALVANHHGAKVLLVEKSHRYGGSTSLSGGVIWVPDNPHQGQHGIDDSTDAGFDYLDGIVGEDDAERERIRAYVENARLMTEWTEANTEAEFLCLEHYPDYYPESEGGLTGGRSLEPQFFDLKRLGRESLWMNKVEFEGLWQYVTFQAWEARDLLQGGAAATWRVLQLLADYALDFRARLGGLGCARVTLGAALIGRLRLSMMKAGIPLWTASPIKELIVEDGHCLGAVVERRGELLRVRARRGVLLATGGFEHDPELRGRTRDGLVGDAWAAGNRSNRGDAVRIAEGLGLPLRLMDEAWWCPVFRVPGEPAPRLVIFEKNLPGSIIVDAAGQRFMNEAAPYDDVGRAILEHQAGGADAIPCWLIFDSRYRKAYPVGPIINQMPDAQLSKEIREGFLHRADTLEALAAKIGVDPKGLEASVKRNNEMTAKGVDEDFGRGASAQDRYYAVGGEPPNPTLGKIGAPPFYAVPVYPGDLGTKGGLVTDVHGRVIDAEGGTVEGLYAAGNCSASMMGRTYPGAGGTIGPAMTFAWLASRHAMEVDETDE